MAINVHYITFHAACLSSPIDFEWYENDTDRRAPNIIIIEGVEYLKRIVHVPIIKLILYLLVDLFIFYYRVVENVNINYIL